MTARATRPGTTDLALPQSSTGLLTRNGRRHSLNDSMISSDLTMLVATYAQELWSLRRDVAPKRTAPACGHFASPAQGAGGALAERAVLEL